MNISIRRFSTTTTKKTTETLKNMVLDKINRSSVFTDKLTPDPDLPTVDASKKASKELLRLSRMVNGHYVWVRPERKERYELMAVSPVAMKDLGLSPGDEKDPEFQAVMAGQKLVDDVYPWAQTYSGYQFGQWAGQLGDGRALSLFEANVGGKKRYEVQLKGAGLTPFSRFADGKAVLRSSIREFLGSEALHGLGIPTTRALAITRLPETTARRETREVCAIVCRMAETWIRVGTFDNVRARRSEDDLVKLADFCIDEVFGGEDKLPPDGGNNRYRRLFTEICLRNARTVGQWQAYGFMNGVLNTDNTSIAGLSMDFGPFAFMETADAKYTPNHDDSRLRYSYENQPSVIWWNLVKLSEDMAPLLLDKSIADEDQRIKDTESYILDVGEAYQELVTDTYMDLMLKRLGLYVPDNSDFKFVQSTVDLLQKNSLDYNLFFRRLSNHTAGSSDASMFMQKSRGMFALATDDEVLLDLQKWLGTYNERLAKEKQQLSDEDRWAKLNEVNPNFVLRNWIMNDVIKAAEKKDYELLHKVLKMSLEPFNETWAFDSGFEARLVGEPPKFDRDIQCACSS